MIRTAETVSSAVIRLVACVRVENVFPFRRLPVVIRVKDWLSHASQLCSDVRERKTERQTNIDLVSEQRGGERVFLS